MQLWDMDSAINVITNYKQYLIKNKSIPEDLSERYMNFINFSQRIIKAYKKSDIGALLQVKTELSETPKTEFKKMLMEKINLIEEKINKKK